MDNDIARVLSWHLSGDMDCVITLTTDKVHEVLARQGNFNLYKAQKN